MRALTHPSQSIRQSPWSANISPSNQEFPSISRNPNFQYCFKTSRHLFLSWNRLSGTPSHHIFKILYFQLYLGLANLLFPLGLRTKTLYAFHLSAIRATCPSHITARSLSQYNLSSLCCSNSYCQSPALYSPALTNVLPMVRSSARDSQRFTVSVNVEPQKKVNFKLTYEELLTRKLGTYRHVVNLDPGQIVNDLKVTTRIEESSNITTLKVPALRTSNEIVEDPSGKHGLKTASLL